MSLTLALVRLVLKKFFSVKWIKRSKCYLRKYEIDKFHKQNIVQDVLSASFDIK